MNTHEYQAKALLRNYGVVVPDYVVIERPEEVADAMRALRSDKVVLKIQVHAGGRGKGGGVRLVEGVEAARRAAQEMIGMRLINEQTGEEGVVARRLLITPQLHYRQEYYLAVLVDRELAQIALIASAEGGMAIEELAVSAPHKILKLPLGPLGQLRGYHLIRLCKFMGWQGAVVPQAKELVEALLRLFWESDATLLEINPLVLSDGGQLVALDAKLSVDDNALWRHHDLQGLFDLEQLPASEVAARQYDLSYIALDGTIGCMVNGAGLAMATMDIIKYHGGKPANFLDVGGGATEEKVSAGFALLMGDPHVRAILVNIFGGIMNCETLATGIIAAARGRQLTVPLVVRMEGTNVERGRQLLSDSALPIILADTLADAAGKVVAAAKRP